MSIVNVYGDQNTIKKARDAMNGITGSTNLHVPTNGEHVRMNSNADGPTTFQRLEDSGFIVGYGEFMHNGRKVTEVVALQP